MNNEFLKGIKARERVVILKELRQLDSIQLVTYSDSIVPNYERMVSKSKEEVTKLYTKVELQETEMKVYRYGFLAMSVLAILGFLF